MRAEGLSCSCRIHLATDAHSERVCPSFCIRLHHCTFSSPCVGDLSLCVFLAWCSYCWLPPPHLQVARRLPPRRHPPCAGWWPTPPAAWFPAQRSTWLTAPARSPAVSTPTPRATSRS